MQKSKAFTLIELLVVISIIALLLSILMPSLNNIKKQARTVICRSNLKQWGYVFSLYANDNEDSFPQSVEGDGVTAADAWMLGATLPYYKDLDMRMCPSTKPPPPGDTKLEGGTFEEWGVFGESPDGSQWYDSFATGSYGFNDWCADVPPWAPDQFWPGLNTINVIRKTYEQGAYNIPLVGDSVFLDTAPKEHDDAPSNAEHEADEYMASYANNSMKYYCIDRHKGGINATFVDMTARHVGIKELWLLKWHKNFGTRHEPPSGWPTWTDKYKDY